MKKLRVAVVGVGNIGNIHADVYSKRSDCEIVAVCDIIPGRSDRVAEKFKCQGFYSVKELLKSGIKIDAASMCTAGTENGEERELTVMLMVDASSSGSFGSVARTKNEVAAEIAALLPYSAIRSNDRVGLILFTDRVERFVPPKKGKKHVMRVVGEILAFEEQSRKTDLAAGLDFMGKIALRRSVVSRCPTSCRRAGSGRCGSWRSATISCRS